jgi:hypothetical protein
MPPFLWRTTSSFGISCASLSTAKDVDIGLRELAGHKTIKDDMRYAHVAAQHKLVSVEHRC